MRLLDKFKKKGFESENVKPENSEEIIVDRFPFADAPNTACFTCRHVLEEHKPILYVSHSFLSFVENVHDEETSFLKAQIRDGGRGFA